MPKGQPREFTLPQVEPEVQAYFYQQLMEVEPFLITSGQLGFALDATKDGQQKLTIFFKTEDMEVGASSKGTDLYEMSKDARVKLQKKLSQLAQIAVDDGARVNLVNMASNHPYLH